MTWPIPFHRGARSPLYLKQISSPCIRRISAKERENNLRTSTATKTYRTISYPRPLQFFKCWCYSPGTKTRQNTQLSCHYLNQSLAEWNKQFFSYSSPGPIWLWCYLGSNSKERAHIMFLKSCLSTTTILTVLNFKTVEKHKTCCSSVTKQTSVFIIMGCTHTTCRSSFCFKDNVFSYWEMCWHQHLCQFCRKLFSVPNMLQAWLVQR